MKTVFSIGKPFRVPDGTLLSPFLNAKDSESGLPFDLLDGFSIAAGRIEPGTCSKIHVMPHVTQVTFVRGGRLVVKWKGPRDAEHQVTRPLTDGQAALTEPGAFLQLVNEGPEPCDVLYIVSPAYVFEMGPGGAVAYDDSLVLDEDWDDLAAAGWTVARPLPTPAQRAAALGRLAERRR